MSNSFSEGIKINIKHKFFIYIFIFVLNVFIFYVERYISVYIYIYYSENIKQEYDIQKIKDGIEDIAIPLNSLKAAN